jgi:hypothetical protein
MTVRLWDQAALHRTQLQQMAETRTFSDFMAVLQNSIPQHFAPGAPISGEQAARELGRIDGWREMLSLIDYLIHGHKPNTIIDDIDYEPTNRDSGRDEEFKP